MSLASALPDCLAKTSLLVRIIRDAKDIPDSLKSEIAFDALRSFQTSAAGREHRVSWYAGGRGCSSCEEVIA